MPTVFLGMGGNIASWAGAPEQTLTLAVARLTGLGRLTRLSSLYRTEPVGYDEQPEFVNAVAALECELAPHALLEELFAIEKEFGRDRRQAVANGPRPLDLDILLYGERLLTGPELLVPHPRLGERAFVLVPLAEIAPHLRIPPQGPTVSELLGRLRDAHGFARIESPGWMPILAPERR